MNPLIFLATGLTVGGVSCLAVQGGLLASLVAIRTQQTSSKTATIHAIWSIGAFLVSKLLVYTLLGFLLGLFGKQLQISNEVSIVVQFVVGLYMIAVALNLLNIHPVFRYVIISPPYFLSRLVRNQSKSKDLFAPILLGLLTVFIPCGTTLAMEMAALSTGNPWQGALIMLFFTIGTFPLFFSLGYLASSLTAAFKQRFLKIAAWLIIYLGLLSINGSLNLLGFPITLESIYRILPIEINLNGSTSQLMDKTIVTENGVQTASIAVMATGYSPSSLTLKAGVKTRLNLITAGNIGCASQFKIPQLNITKDLPDKGTTVIEFTPKTKGQLTFTCAMGMFRGSMTII